MVEHRNKSKPDHRGMYKTQRTHREGFGLSLGTREREKFPRGSPIEAELRKINERSET